MSQSTISARINSEDKKAFDMFCAEVGLNTSSVINMFVKKVISENKIPFEISTKNSVSLEEGRKAFLMLREEVSQNNIQDLSLEEINNEIYQARKDK